MINQTSVISTLLIAVAVLLCGCEQSGSKIEVPELGEDIGIELTAEQENISISVNDFAFRLFAASYEGREKESFLLSPLSLSIDLSLCAAGAKGETEKQMKEVMGLAEFSADELKKYSYKLMSGLDDVDTKTKFTSANSIWHDYNISLKDSYVADAKEFYLSEVYSENLDDAEIIGKVNDWCRENTEGLVPELIDEIPQARMMLLNAVYFKGEWKNNFTLSNYPATFNGINGPYNVYYFRNNEDYLYEENELFQTVRLPYGNGSFSMTIILPFEGKFNQTVACLEDQTVAASLINMKNSRIVNTTIPKFKIETSQLFNETLEDMGMILPFSDKSDFSGMSESSLAISKILQRTLIEVDEAGTAAGSVTDIELGDISADAEVSFTANRPFIFFISEAGSQSILFIGQKV